MENVKFLLKFGGKKYLKDLQEGKLYFSNAYNFKNIEKEKLLKGQGDLLEGGTILIAQDLQITNNDNKEVININDVKVKLNNDPANLLPVYCLFACFEKDCYKSYDGKYEIKLSEEIKETIISHFPKADAVAIIKEPQQFIDDVNSSIGYACKSNLVKYFHLKGIMDSKFGIVNDLDYYKYVTQDTPLVKKYGKIILTMNVDFIYRTLLCKDIFFCNEQEYRFILPEINIKKARNFPIHLNEKIEIVDLDLFFHK
ncbi:hypothetical protein JYG23_03005 [Sedimentibacter sp. zth1]|uniref:hypothetical protein n=1 Tax=Sedimentibacter sp. zth1 TaxID=2816908 RepID=UPI001A91C04C|nr:hypothetical protein [Sedimentibacter sp. zth1]QSX06446.1 hypothetical protein JYG23_03005 [Sedimentibacter sp. zth1]